MSEQNKKLNEAETAEVSGGESENSNLANDKKLEALAQQAMKEPHWTYKKHCRICHKEYEVTCWSHEKAVMFGVCPECKNKGVE